MARLIGLGIAAASIWVAPVHANSVGRWQPYVSEASLRFGIPEDWIARVMRAESGGQTQRNGKPIRSRVGAIGLMQIMPKTWAELRVRYSLGANPDDPRANILGGAAYLREMYDQFGYPGLFAAYNAGPTRYSAYAAGRSRLPRETIAYVASVTGGASSMSPASSAPAVAAQNDIQLASVSSPPTVFFRVTREPYSESGLRQVSAPSTLFVTLKTAQRGSE